jgi:hypothetical protein
VVGVVVLWSERLQAEARTGETKRNDVVMLLACRISGGLLLAWMGARPSFGMLAKYHPPAPPRWRSAFWTAPTFSSIRSNSAPLIVGRNVSRVYLAAGWPLIISRHVFHFLISPASMIGIHARDRS